ncbi:MAG TPA: hypothetical protein VGF97_02685 [Rhizomicrobium sp.]|jgi:hypothetical protein
MAATSRQRLISAGAVIALHVAFLGSLLLAMRTHPPVSPQGREIQLVLPAIVTRHLPFLPAPPEPSLEAPAMPPLPAAPEALAPPPPPAPAMPAPGAILGIGRALFGCDPMTMDSLSPDDRARCLHLAPGKLPERNVRLGPPPDPNSPFEKVIEERHRDANTINRPCPPGSYNDTHGLECFGFDDKAPLLPGQ